jgi:hypothetical protein
MNNDYSDQYKIKGDFIKDGFMLATGVSCISRELMHLSKAFASVGNAQLSDQFCNLFEELGAISDSIKTLVGNRTQSDLESAQKMSGAILSSCLAGMEIEKQNLTSNN